MKIAIIHHSGPPLKAGVERVVGEQIQLLRKNSHTVTLACSGEGGCPFTPDAHVPLSRGSSCEEYVAYLSSALAGTDVVLMHNVCSVPELPQLTLALRHLPALLPSARWICWVHDFAPADDADGAADAAAHSQAYASACEGWEYVAVSEARAREVEAFLGVACTVVPNGVDPAVILQLSAKVASFAEKSGCWDADAVLLAPARLAARKNLELGIQVVHAARERGFRMQMLLTGGENGACPADMGYAKYLRILAGSLKLEDAVFFLGKEIAMGERVFFEYQQVADALFFSGAREGFGLPVLEGGVLGKPVFCLEHEAVSRLPGASVFAGDLSVPELADAMIGRILGSETIMARRKILRDYRWPSIYHNHIEPLLMRSPPPYHP